MNKIFSQITCHLIIKIMIIFILFVSFAILSLLKTPFLIKPYMVFADSLWNIVSSPNVKSTNDILNGIATVSKNDIWAVGYSYPSSSGGQQTLIEHWDGNSWSIVDSPNVGLCHNELTGVTVVSSNDIWAVGTMLICGGRYQTLIEHWDGKNWSIVSSPNFGLGGNWLSQIAKISANDIWAIGYAENSNSSSQTLIEHWDGNSWSIVDSPNVGGINTNNTNRLNSLFTISTNDIWAVGSYDEYSSGSTKTLMEHWDGNTWGIISSPNASNGNFMYGVTAISTNSVWAVGYYVSSNGVYQVLTEHWDGKNWRIIPNPNKQDTYAVLNGIAAFSANDIWTVGYYWVNNTDGIPKTLTEHWDGNSWNIVPSPNAGGNGSWLNGITTVSANDIWAVGYLDLVNQNPSQRTLIEHYPTSIISNPPPPPTQPCTLPNFGDSNGNPLRQYDSQWGGLPYGGGYYKKADGTKVFLPFIDYGNNNDTIGTWGCKLTSAVMIVNYFAKEQNVIDPTTGSIFQTDPQKLNTWLQQKDNGKGYYNGVALPAGNPTHWDSAGVDLSPVVKYAKENGVQLSYDGTLRPNTKPTPPETIDEFITRTKERINQSMCALNPVILGVNNGGHFVDATGKTVADGIDTWQIHDPLWNGILPGISTLKAKYNNQYNQVDLMSGKHPKRHLTIIKYSPIEMYVTDPQGRREGFDVATNTSFDEIPDASYGLEHLAADDGGNGLLEYGVLDIPNPEDGQYTLTVTGTGNGSYGLEVRETDNETNTTSTQVSGTAVDGQTETYLVTSSSTPDQQNQLLRDVTINIRPLGQKNTINPKSKGKVPVAILSSATFNAPGSVDKTSLTFGHTGDEKSLAYCNPDDEEDEDGLRETICEFKKNKQPKKKPFCYTKDINKDKLPDLICYFNIQQTGFQSGDTQGFLNGKTISGTLIKGTDVVRIIH